MSLIIRPRPQHVLPLEMANAAKRRYEEGLNPESFAARVHTYEKLSVDGMSEAAKMSGSRSYRLLSVAYEISRASLTSHRFTDVG